MAKAKARKPKSKRSQADTRRNRDGAFQLNRSIIAWNSNSSDKTVFVLDKKTMRERPVTDNLHWAIDRMDHYWKMCIVCVGITPEGRTNFHPYALNPCTEDNPGPHNHKNLVDVFNKIHADKLGKINPKFKQGAMWMASLDEIDYTDEQLEQIWSMT